MITAPVKWVTLPAVQPSAELLDLAHGQRLAAQALVRRGYSTPALAAPFLFPDRYSPSNPFELPDMEKGVERLEEAFRTGEHIGVWGDFDADGQTSTSLLVQTLTWLGAKVTFHIPVRGKESHGIAIPALDDFLSTGVKLILTCDTGVTAHPAVEHCTTLGIDVVITDHHTLPADLPSAHAVINPQRLPEGHPLRPLCGVGTAYKLAEALLGRAAKTDLIPQLWDLVAIGSVADLAALTGDGRWLVQKGLDGLRHTNRSGLKKLAELAEIQLNNLSEEQVGFAIAPRLNAIGRLGDANPIVSFLIDPSEQEAAQTAGKLEGLNQERRSLTDAVFKGALSQIEKDPGLLQEPVLILSHPEWPAGVVGITASRLVELYHRPTILFHAIAGGNASGSARSVEGINITQAISEQTEILNGFGGHPMAAGLSLPTDSLPEFRRRMSATIARMSQALPEVLELPIDAWVNLQDLNLDLALGLEPLAPFGAGNPPLILAIRNLTLQEVREIGKNRDHRQLTVVDAGGSTAKVMWWQGSGSPLPEGLFDLAVTLRARNYRGQMDSQIEFIAVRSAERSLPELTSPSTQYEIIDRRLDAAPIESLISLANDPDCVTWREGLDFQNIPGSDRFGLTKARTLVIATLPPDRDTLQKALQIVRPQKVILFGLNPTLPGKFQVHESAAKMINYALKQKNGAFSAEKMAAFLGVTRLEIDLVIRGLAAAGKISVETEEGDLFHVVSGGTVNEDLLHQFESALEYTFKETTAYRQYFLQSTDVAALLPSLLRKTH
ncbi:MAG TPA: single-stranded-DNA-specific exonuclease RecJ [Longilinea sp.]|nr:single-stranded-DNA-specific exonuclease RecJ [Longilinea sp.]